MDDDCQFGSLNELGRLSCFSGAGNGTEGVAHSASELVLDYPA